MNAANAIAVVFWAWQSAPRWARRWSSVTREVLRPSPIWWAVVLSA